MLRVCSPQGWVSEKFIVLVLLSCTVAGLPLVVFTSSEVFKRVLPTRLREFEMLVCEWSVVALDGSPSRLSVYLLKPRVKVVQSAGKSPNSESSSMRSEMTEGLASDVNSGSMRETAARAVA